MQHFPKKQLSTYKLNSIFIKIFIILIIMSAIMFFVVYGFLSKMIRDNSEEKARLAAYDTLETISAYLEQDMIGVGRNMNQLLWNADVIGAVLSPDTADYARKEAVIKNLSNLVRNHPLIAEAYLLTYSDRMAYEFTGVIENIPAFTRAEIFRQYHEQASDNSHYPLRDEDFSSVPYVAAGDIFLFQKFPTAEENAILMVTINQDEMFRSLQNLAAGEGARHIQIFTHSGIELYPEAGRQSEDSGYGESYVSPATGWRYYYNIQDYGDSIGWREIIWITMPMLLVFFLVSIVLSAYVSSSIYRPVNRLFQSVLGQEAGADSEIDAKNELEYIQISYQNTLEEAGKLSRRVAAIAPAMREKLYKQYLLGRDVTAEQGREAMKTAGVPFSAEDSLAVLVLSLVPMAKYSSDLEKGLIYVSLENSVKKAAEGYCHDCVLMDDDTLVVIVAFSRKDVCTLIKSRISELCDGITDKIKEIPYEICIGKSAKAAVELQNICYVYREACEDLRRQLYLNQGDDELAEAVQAPPDAPMDASDRYNEASQGMLRLAFDGNINEALALLQKTIGAIQAESGSDQAERQTLEQLLDLLTERLISLQVDTGEWAFVDELSPEKTQGILQEEYRNRAREVMRRVLRLLDTYGGKTRFRYIEKAKGYILEYYYDSALSLNVVADYVGISTAYLSRLFFEISGQRFVDYLNQCRVDQAKQLLGHTSLSIQEIGFKTGFNSAQSFNRVFKRYTNETPGKYRRA